MKNFVVKPAWALLLMSMVLMGNAHARSPSSGAGDSPSASKASKTTSSKSKAAYVSQIKFLPGSEETAKERSSRLKRECRGRVNAGACSGYTY